MQQSYAALWDYDLEIKLGLLTVDEADARCRQVRDAEARKWRAAGHKVFTSSVPAAEREYWGMNEPCGLTCTAYYLTVAS